MANGFYSVIQYCPNRFRAEGVNVGLVLLSLEPHALRVQMTHKFDRVRKLFGISKPDLNSLKIAIEAMKSRIESVTDGWRTPDEFAAFAGSRANDLRMTEPRLAKIAEINADFERLFSELVDGRTTASLAVESPAEVLPPRLSEVFYKLQQEHKIWRPGQITVPVFKTKLEIPYAYKNGVVNLIKPQVFSATKQAETQAAKLAINGDLIQRDPINGDRYQLIIVSTQETSEQAKEIDDHIDPLFKAYGVRFIRPANADAFANEVEQNAH